MLVKIGTNVINNGRHVMVLAAQIAVLGRS